MAGFEEDNTISSSMSMRSISRVSMILLLPEGQGGIQPILMRRSLSSLEQPKICWEEVRIVPSGFMVHTELGNHSAHMH